MTLTKEHQYSDADGDIIRIEEAAGDDGDRVAYINTESASHGAYVTAATSVPLALNVLGYDRPDDDRVTTTRDFIIGEGNGVQCTATVAHGGHERERQLNLAVALLHAVDAYDQRAARLATAEERRAAAAKALGATVATIRRAAVSNEFTGDDIGKLREALGRYDAALAN